MKKLTRRQFLGTKAKGYRVFQIDNEMNVTTEFKEVNTAEPAVAN